MCGIVARCVACATLRITNQTKSSVSISERHCFLLFIPTTTFALANTSSAEHISSIAARCLSSAKRLYLLVPRRLCFAPTAGDVKLRSYYAYALINKGDLFDDNSSLKSPLFIVLWTSRIRSFTFGTYRVLRSNTPMPLRGIYSQLLRMKLTKNCTAGPSCSGRMRSSSPCTRDSSSGPHTKGPKR